MSDNTNPPDKKDKLHRLFDRLCDRMAEQLESGELTDKGTENIIKFLAANGISAQAAQGSPIGKVLEAARESNFKLTGSGKLPPIAQDDDRASNDRAFA